MTVNQQVTIKNYYHRQGIDSHRRKILKGLTAKKKYIPSVYFYDETGSKLFEEITRLPEYYPPEKESYILKNIASEINGELKHIDLVELGSGDCTKISILLQAVHPTSRKTIRYLPFDVSRNAIEKSAKMLLNKFPNIQIYGIVANFETQLHHIPHERKRIFCFFGSTIGNMTKNQSRKFLLNLSGSMETGDIFLLGVDMVKPKNIIERAYNDRQNVTAEFNLNILKAANRYAETNFDPDDFEHVAFYNEEHSRIEMHLKAKEDVEINSPYLEPNIFLKKGETIHTENSHKYNKAAIHELAEIGGFDIQKIFADKDEWFSVIQFIKK